jgi:hypothetical protein
MILPSKHLAPGRDLLTVGAALLQQIEEPLTVSELWARVQKEPALERLRLAFDWFILTLSFLYTVKAIDYDRGIIARANP